MANLQTSESFVACWPYTAVAAMLPGESIVYANSRDSAWYTITKRTFGGYLIEAESDIVGFCQTAKEARAMVAFHLATMGERLEIESVCLAFG